LQAEQRYSRTADVAFAQHKTSYRLLTFLPCNGLGLWEKVMLRSNSLVVQRVPIVCLQPLGPPVRRHPEKQAAKLRKSLAIFGQVVPILATPEFKIIDHELVWRAMKANGATHVDVIVVADKSPAEIKALRLMLNRSAIDAVWDDENLRSVLQDLTAFDFDLELTGFDPPEIDCHLSLDLPQGDVEENATDIPPLEIRSVSSRGVIWAAGNHRIGCGDARDRDFVSHVLDGRRAHVIFIDPPHANPVDGFGGKGRDNERNEFTTAAGASKQFFAFFRDSLDVAKICSAPTALVYACIDWRRIMEMTVAGRACEMPLFQIITWLKSNARPNGIYRNASEFIAVFRSGKNDPLDNVELGRRGRNRTNVWNYPSVGTFGKRRNYPLAPHPTIKPVAMIADILRDVTKRGEVLLDTFLGSGTSLIAAHDTGRVCCGVELDPLYVDVAIRRWQNITGREATNIHTGETFNVSAAQRLLDSPPGAH
jgi:DNA modification methylase